jgi:diguanylate cyclase (GGDEF)-like protein
MKNKTRLIIIAIIIMLIGLGWAIYYILNRSESDTTLSILDKRWIENNKEQVVDMAILNDLPIYGYEGNGIFFEFIKSLEANTGLEFNKVPYVIGSAPSLGEYVYKILGTNIEANEKQILIYEDFYVILGKTDKQFNDLKEINGSIGVLNEDIAAVSYYLTSSNITYKPYETATLLFEGFNNDEVNLIVLPYNLYINTILSNDNYFIKFHLNDVSKQYVLELSDENERLNDIITKYYNKWSNDQYEQVYNQYLFDLYLVNRKIDSVTKNEFQSKRYNYGLINYLPYEMVLEDELIGINSEYINLFSAITGVEFKFLKYNNINELNKAIADGLIDISFNYYNTVSGDDYIKSISPYKEEYVLLVHDTQDIVINSLKSIEDNKVVVLKDTLLSNYLKEHLNADIIEIQTLDDLLKNNDKTNLILIDGHTYDYYQDKNFNNYKVVLRDKLNKDYTFLLKQSDDNKVFIDLFNQFIVSIDYRKMVSKANIDLLQDPVRQNLIEILSRYILLIIIAIYFFAHITVTLLTKQKVKKKLKKEDKLKYTDMLTSLKNRSYLNDHIEEWENNKNYPQAIVIIDLNNVKYVNDNYGHEEGDNLIKKAAVILINTQLEKSEIIRSDGNEFLIYLVGYTEQQVLLYTRKLYKEFKNLPHEFGAAIGFSMIEDDIKTIDDAMNEAVLDMRTNKEGQKE